MHLSVIDDDAHVAGIRAGERTLFHTFHDTLQDSGHETQVDSTTHNGVDEDELSTPLQVDLFLALDVHLELLTVDLERGWIRHSLCIGLHDQVNLTKLTGTTRLFLMTVVGTCHLCDGLTIGNLWLQVLDIDLLIVLHTPFQGTQVELSLSVNDDLTELLRLLYHPCGILLTHLRQGSHHLLRITLVDGLHGT